MTTIKNRVKDELLEAMSREAINIRSLLTSLHDEHHAIVTGNEEMLDTVLEERLTIISSYEKWGEKVINLTIELAKESEVPIADPQKLRHCEAIILLQECLDPDDFEHLSVRQQIEALIEEVHYQNDLNARLLKENPRFLNFREAYAIPLASPLEKKKPKNAIAVMDE